MEPRTHTQTSKNTPFVWLAVTVGVLIIGFFAGMLYLSSQKNTDDQLSANQGMGSGPQMMNGPGPGGGGGTCANGQPKGMLMINGQQVESCGMPAKGQVTAVTASSVTVATDDGASKTFNVTDKTTVSQKEGSATLADIKTGDTLAVITDPDDETLAQYLIINPPQ